MANELPVARGLGLAPVHFHLQPWEGGHFLEDAGTGLGTLVNERMVSWVPLQNGDTIRAGDLQVTYVKDPAGGVPEIPVFAGNVVTLDTSPVPGSLSTAEKSISPPAPPVAPEPPPEPPSWLPPEALGPLAPPPAWEAPAPPPGKGRRRITGFLVLLFLAAAGGAAWHFTRK